jgi:hypothetical protein
MGARTTLKELVAHWATLTAEERLDYRVRFGDDVYEVIALDEDDDQVQVRGYQLNGPLAASQRDANSRAMRVRIFPLNLGGVEILDRDEPVEPEPVESPPTLRLAEDGEYERIEPEPQPQWEPTAPEPPMFERIEPQTPPSSRETFDAGLINVEALRQAGTADLPARQSALDTPVEEWASTAVRLPRDLLDRLAATARERMVGRSRLMAYLLERGLDDIDRGN